MEYWAELCIQVIHETRHQRGGRMFLNMDGFLMNNFQMVSDLEHFFFKARLTQFPNSK